jgi:chorismate dehydratase
MKLRIGKIPYTNLFPIFYMLQKECDCSQYEFIEGVPSELNKKIHDGQIDVSPSSAIEYLRNPDKYDLIENHSVSSKGSVGSILLFSKRPIETLHGLAILVSSHSETSVALLEIILRKFYEIECPLKFSSEPLERALRSHSAYMLIGDQALTEALRWPKLYIYDLGNLWSKNTGLPCTFALWFSRKESGIEMNRLIDAFREDLQKAKTSAVNNLDLIASESPIAEILSAEELSLYWKGISYDFGEEHKKGLYLFKQYALEFGILRT